MIDTREELVNALTEAAELEHGLMIQYLYAAFTLRLSNDPGLVDRQRALVDAWRGTLLRVAHQEMGHLATVHNLLEAVGGGSHLEALPFPVESRYYDPPLAFSLEPLNLQTAKRFVDFEAPTHTRRLILELAPEPIEYKSVGDLYRQIGRCIELIPEDQLFIGSKDAEDTLNWSRNVEVRTSRGKAEALAAIEWIVEQGEGTSTGAADSHWAAFSAIYAGFQNELTTDPAFTPYRDVVSNPRSRRGGTEAFGTSVLNPAAVQVLDLFNSSYATLLMALMQYYKFQERADIPVPGFDPAVYLRNACVGIMQGVLKPLGQFVLPEMDAGLGNGKKAGPSFEASAHLRVPWERNSTWKILIERLGSEIAFAESIRPLHTVIPDVLASLQLIQQQLADFVEETHV